MFYVYEWYNKNTGEIFYVGKGTRNRVNHINKRNVLFKMYYTFNPCLNRILKYFENEEDALNFEHDRIIYLKRLNQCSCNLDDGGKGGLKIVWTDEMRKYKSEYNPMKRSEQKLRMSFNNPMKNIETVRKVAKSKSKPVVVGNKYFESVKSAGEYYKVFPTEITKWCKRGYDKYKKPCRYAFEKYKNFILKTTNSKKVIIDDKVFNSVREGSKYLSVWPETLIRCIKQKRLCKGHNVKYDNQQPSVSLNDLRRFND